VSAALPPVPPPKRSELDPIELASRDGFHKSHLCRHDMPG